MKPMVWSSRSRGVFLLVMCSACVATSSAQHHVQRGEQAEIHKPRRGNVDIPRPSETDIPRHGKTDIHRSGETDIPRPGKTDIPSPGKNEIPRSGDTNIPRPGKAEIPRHGQTDIPRPRERDLSRPRGEGAVRRRQKRFLGSLGKALECAGKALVGGSCKGKSSAPTCGGKTTADGGCDATFSNSHLIDTSGTQVTSVDGDCPAENSCNCPKDGFYSAGENCQLCTDIAHCNYETCTKNGDQICSYCEGVVQDQAGWRAYKMSGDKKACDQACSWRLDSNRCYPGTCPTEVVSSCTCAASFTGPHCGTISETPDILYNALQLETTGTNKFFPSNYNQGPSATQNDVWTNNINPDSLMYEFRSQYVRSMPARPIYIKAAIVGVSAASAQLRLLNKAGSQKAPTLSRTCSGVSENSPNTNILTCSETFQRSFYSTYLPVPFAHEDWIEFTFNAVAGGYVVVENKENNNVQTKDYFVTNTKTHTFQVHFDTVVPYHCLTSCADNMLSMEQISTTATISIAWGGWADAAAGLWKFGYRVYDLTPRNGILQHAAIDVHGEVATNTASGQTTFTLKGSTGIYAVYLDAYDRAGNIKSARKLVLYDDGSLITRNAGSPLRVTSAASVTSWAWQQTEGPITLTWTGRYTNVFHDHNKVNYAVASEADVESSYDDNEGNMTVTTALNNVLGIVEFTTAYAIDQQGGTTLTLPADSSFTLEPDLSGGNTYQANVVDGDTLIFWVRAYDIRGEYNEESVTVHVDSSPPVIHSLWLTKDHILNLSVHGLQDLNTMTIEWEAYDIHSGLREVQWRVFDNFTGQDIVHGQEFVQAQGQMIDLATCQTQYASYIRGPNCYCTGPVDCYHQHFKVQPNIINSVINTHGGMFHDKNAAVHDYNYFMEVTVYNHANLSTTLRTQITVDLSPPHPGSVGDGVSGSPEVDYQSTTDLYAHWWGFFDRESGVKYYQYAFHTACVDATAFTHDTTDPRVTETYEQFASWTAPGDGTYYVTVVAFNSAREPSVPVCSDGVVVDSLPPVMTHFFVEGAHVAPGVLVSSAGGPAGVWFMDQHRRLRLVDSPDSACSTVASGVTASLDMYASSPLTSPMNGTEACSHGALDSKFLSAFYISRDMHLFLNWTASDAHSGIFDFEVGLATSSSATVPDLSAFQSTHHHPFYKQYHPTLTEGTPFYILVKATNKAAVTAVEALGPVELVRTGTTYAGSVTLTLDSASDTLEVTWDTNQFRDVERTFLQFSVALEEQSEGTIVHPYSSPHFSGACSPSTPPSCTTFPLSSLHWGLHEAHTYLATVKVVNIVGLNLVLTSDPYTHDTRLAAAGSVFEMVPSGEEAALGIQRSEDTDFQLSTSTLEAAWSGFEDGTLSVTYTVGLGTSPGANDVSSFVPASSKNEHMFSGLSLQVDTKYYVTVVAMTSAGTTTVTSDGVTVIQADQPATGLTVSDGPGCNVTAMSGWTPEHHADLVDLPCEDDASFQTSSDTLWGHWTMTTDQRHRYPDVVFKVQKIIPGTNSWSDVTGYLSSSRNDFILAQGLPLQAGGLFRLAVKLCVSAACSLPLYSSGVHVTNAPPVTGSIEVLHSNATGVSMLDVTVEYFRDADITDVTSAQSAVLGYQWSLSHRLHDNSQPMLTTWQDVPALQPVNATHGLFTITLTAELSFHKCLILTVRGVSKVGFVSTLHADLMDCEAFDPALVIPRLVLDAMGDTVDGSLSEGLPVTMAFNDRWTRDDVDYTPHSNILSAVWPMLRQSQVTWAVLESQGPDVTSHFLDPAAQPLLDPCSSPLQIACEQLTSQKYINVEFGTGGRPALQNGRHYYVCVHAAAETVTHEKWVEELPEVTACSDGVTVDLTSPTAGQVSVDGLRHGIYQMSVSVVSVRWNGFQDIEDMGLTAHHSGILSYQIAVGSVPGGQDVLNFLDVGLVNYHSLHSLVMLDGHVYYVTVKALDMVGRSVTSSSPAFVVDSSAPERTSANFRFAEPYFTSAISIDLCWTDMFTDGGSGIDYYLVTVGSRPGHDDIMKSVRVLEDCTQLNTDTTMINGHAYYVTVGAVNGAGMETVATSKPVAVMTTSPTVGAVFDGPSPTSGSQAADVDFVTSPDDVIAYWSGFSTSLNPVTSYSVSLGTCPGCVDVMADFDVGLTQAVTWNHAPLRHDIRYYTTVTACNAVGQCNQATSDGVMIDVTPPVTGPVWDGTGDEEFAYQSQRDFLGAQWRGFSDLGSGLTGFTWRAGTTTGGSDVMPERDVGLVFSAFTKDLPALLPEAQIIYITVKATDAAGNQKEVTSNGFQVDSSAPVTSTQVELSAGVGTVDGVGVVSRDMLGVRWAIEDPQSHIVTQHVSVYSHIYGEFQSASEQIPGPTRKYIINSLSLHDGSRYKVKVTACNLAHLCTTSESADILHDSSPPSTGMFAIQTDHSANLERHLATWMQWTSSSLRLAWLGFHDQHSGVHSYHVNVGTTPYARDLNQGSSTVTVPHSSSGTSYEDEGYVQVYEVNTQTLTANQDVYVTVWAINGVGLKSHPAMSKFRLQSGGALFLHRRCVTFNCLSHCVCSVQGATCGASTTCTDYTSISNPNSQLTVYDHADLSVLSTSNPAADLYQASLTYLAATWKVTTSQGQLPVRYEVSAGRSDQSSPLGVFNIVDDRVWTDVGLDTSAITSVPADNPLLTDKLSYSTFVRAWYADGSFAVFKSSGITPRISGPTLTNLVGRAVKEHSTSAATKDVDFVTSSSIVYVSWDGKFISTTAPVTTFDIYIGTRPEAADVYVGTAGGSEVRTIVTGLTLQEDTLYYTTVTALGGSQLLAWDTSDGFILDTQKPQAGLVMDGTGLDDLDYQPSDTVASANWRGFYDAASGVRRYMWCVGTISDVFLCDVIPWTDVGLNTSARTDIGSSVSQGTTLFSKVYAVDAAGHSSAISVSDGVTVDTTAPTVLSMVYTTGINYLFNPSFETDTALNADLTQCDAQPPASWQITASTCVTLHRPTHAVSVEGVQHVVLSGSLQQTVNTLTPGSVYRLTLKLAHPHNALASQKPITGHVTLGTQTTPFELDPSLCWGVCDTDLEPVMLWHSFSFVATASSTTMDIAIATSVISLDQQVAVDDVLFEEIRKLASPGGSSEQSVSSSGVFMAEWSVVQTSWHFHDDVSPIVDYQWALGTSKGGVQLQGFRSVGRRQHASLPGLSLSHGTSLYVTVLARNAAGMTSVAYSLPLAVDMTPPDIINLWDGASGEEVDYQTSQVVSARWTVSDAESAAGYCQWAIGTTPGRGDIQPFQLATASPSAPDGDYSVSSDVTAALTSLTLPVTLYLSVRCYNRAVLPARSSTDGVTILPVAGQGAGSGTLRLLPDSGSHYPVLEECRFYRDRLRLRWSGVVSAIPLAGYQIVRSSDNAQGVSHTPPMPYLLEGADLDLNLTLLMSQSNYTVRVNPMDIFGTVTSGPSRTTYVLPDAPTVQVNQAASVSVSDGDLILTWADLFHSSLTLSYEVTAGSVAGGGDILLFRQTGDTQVSLSLQHARQSAFNMSLVLTAIDPCGQFAVHTQDVHVVVV